VALATNTGSSRVGSSNVAVGVKKSNAKASRVSARSRGVAVGVYLGRSIVSSCVSGLSPAIIIGKPNARKQAPISTTRIIALCDFTLSSDSFLPNQSFIPGNCQIVQSQ